jgi:CRP-like cAMP-binding protein
VESGEVRVLLPTGQNQEQLLEVVGPGSVLGLRKSMSGETYRITAEAGDQTTAVFVPREEFLEFYASTAISACR